MNRTSLRTFSAVLVAVILLAKTHSCAQQVLDVTYLHHELLNQFKTSNPCHVAIIVASWCSDCVNSKKTQDNLRQLALSKGWSILNADVGTRAQFSDASNYMRADPLYKVTGLPSLYAIINSAISYSVVDQQVYNQTQVNQLMQLVERGPPASCNTSGPKNRPYPVLEFHCPTKRKPNSYTNIQIFTPAPIYSTFEVGWLVPINYDTFGQVLVRETVT